MARPTPKTPGGSTAKVRLERRQRIAWLRLIRTENVGPATFRALVNQFGGAEAAMEALPMLSRRGGRIHDILYGEEEAEGELEAAEALGAHLVAIGEPGYPPALAEVDAPPPLLYVKGNLDLASAPIIALVGARNGSALSLAVVVVEAAERSGSLITARFAGEQGREVFAVPGSPLDPRSAGTNNLLKQGASLVTGAADIVEALAPIMGRPPAPPGVESPPKIRGCLPLPDIGESERERVVGALGPSPVDIDELDPHDAASDPQSAYRAARA